MRSLDSSTQWHAAWDEHQETHLPGREQCFNILLDVIAAVTPDRPARVLDLAGGIGSLSRRILAARPDADITLLDVDPLALAVAHAELGEAITYCPADLRDPTWALNLRPATFDAVLTTTSLHSLPGPRIQQLYRETSTLLRPDGVMVNADRMPEPGLPTLTHLMDRHRAEHGTDRAITWEQWWQRMSTHPAFAVPAQQRHQMHDTLSSADFYPPATWHAQAMSNAGFRETGVLWRNPYAAAVAGVR